MRRNVSLTNTAVENTAYENDSYEIKIGNTVYVASHEYGNNDLSDIIADYLSDKTEYPIVDNHAA